ncbi:hypothetical protein CWE07_03630 [Aliidiomarina maris]|uniref:DUF4810 domain-containing protein n=2 Tax=Aliidiomarina maris TaxID=531312 RepID=A0ABY0BU10_9GAMM|nr:hypothetical protein CWE07_03630 [Aliidiomarina maris]
MLDAVILLQFGCLNMVDNNPSRQLRVFVVALVTLGLSACAAQPPSTGMYWGNYETSLYTLANSPTDRVSQQHIGNLRNVVSVSDQRGWAPPPGAMLELAVLEAEAGNQAAYVELVIREYRLYPESRVYIHRWFPDVVVPPMPTPSTSPEQATDDNQAQEALDADTNANQ